MADIEPDLVPATPLHAGTGVGSLPAPNKGEPDLVVFAIPDLAAQSAAERIAVALIAAVERRGRADFCTTGGSAVVPIYRNLADTALCEQIPWPQLHIWFGDDRFVPRGHPDSNVTPLDQILLGSAEDARGSAPIPTANIHPFPIDEAIAGLHDNSWCAERYAEEMVRQLPVAEGNWPVFDLILVGIGEDGHVLSVFPESPALDRMEWALGIPAPTHIGPHLPRVTLNPRVLEAAPVLAVAWGQRKVSALASIFGPVRDERRWPAQRARRPGATWIMDEAAAARIPKGRRG